MNTELLKEQKKRKVTREQEQMMNTEHLKEQKKRKVNREQEQDDDYRACERLKEVRVKQKVRLDDEYRASERIKEKESKRRARTDGEYRTKERKSKQRARADDEYRTSERTKEKKSKQRARTDDDYRACEKIKRTSSSNQNEEQSDDEGQDSDTFSEIADEDRVIGNADTLIDPVCPQNDSIYTFAPGEGQRPLSLYSDKDAEELSFPSIFCGKRRIPNTQREIKVNYSDVVKWELRNIDRRAANSVPNLFFKMKKIQMKQISDKVYLALRRCKSKDKNVTAAEALNQTRMDKLDIQTHKHSKTCRKKGEKLFADLGFHYPPNVLRTMILEPLDEDNEMLKKKYSEIQEKITKLAETENLTLKIFLTDVAGITEEEYILCIRASLKSPKVFLKRQPCESSRDVVFINTSEPHNRTFLLKQKDVLEKLPQDSTDIESDNIVKRYAKRPKQLRKMCLADYVAELDISYPKKMSSPEEVNDDDLSKSDSEDEDDADNINKCAEYEHHTDEIDSALQRAHDDLNDEFDQISAINSAYRAAR
ncbi:DNA ligase 1-like [Argopecten irradians]|uniref:DNA ligase 1-like n=1 Tax=Argopecten irradians TaxID=31199 RepID=UPI00371A18FA